MEDLTDQDLQGKLHLPQFATSEFISTCFASRLNWSRTSKRFDFRIKKTTPLGFSLKFNFPVVEALQKIKIPTLNSQN